MNDFNENPFKSANRVNNFSVLILALIGKIIISGIVLITLVVAGFAMARQQPGASDWFAASPLQTASGTEDVLIPLPTLSIMTPTPLVAETSQPTQETSAPEPASQPAPTASPVNPVEPPSNPQNPLPPSGTVLQPSTPISLESASGIQSLGHLGKGRIRDILWSPMGNHFVVGTSNGLTVYNPEDGSEILNIDTASAVSQAALSLDGNLIAASLSTNQVQVWDLSSRQLVRSFEQPGVALRGVSFSPDNTLIAAGGLDGLIYTWDLQSGTPQRTYEGSDAPLSLLHFSPNGQLIAAIGSNNTIRVWNVSSGLLSLNIVGHNRAINDFAFSPDSSTLASASDDGTLIFWDMASGAQLRAISHGQSAVKSAAYNRDGNLIATGASDGNVNLWDPSTGAPVLTDITVSGEVEGVAFSPDGQSLAIGANNLAILNIQSQSIATIPAGYSRSITTVAYNQDSSLLAVGTLEGNVLLFETASNQLVRLFKDHTGEVTSLSFSLDGKYLAAGSLDNTTILWDLASGNQVNVFRGHSNGVKSVQFSPDSTRLITTGGWVDLSVRFWDIVSGENINNLTVFTKGDIKLAAQPGANNLASGGGDRTIRIWNFETREQVAVLEGHSRVITCIAFSADGSLLATASEEGLINIWDTGNWSLVKSLTSQGYGSVAFSLDKRLLIAAGENIEIWEIESGSLIQSIPGSPGERYSIAMRTDGGLLAAGNTDGSLKLLGVP